MQYFLVSDIRHKITLSKPHSMRFKNFSVRRLAFALAAESTASIDLPHKEYSFAIAKHFVLFFGRNCLCSILLL